MVAKHATMELRFAPPPRSMSGSDTKRTNWRVRARYAGLHMVLVASAWIGAAVCLPAHAATEIHLWHAMSGERERQLEALIGQFNASQHDYKVILVLKGGYSETVMSAIFAVRTRIHPAIVQVNEIGTATMIHLPNWLLVFSLSFAGTIAWIRWQFSLRTLLIATTLVAVVLGLIVAVV